MRAARLAGPGLAGTPRTIASDIVVALAASLPAQGVSDASPPERVRGRVLDESGSPVEPKLGAVTEVTIEAPR